MLGLIVLAASTAAASSPEALTMRLTTLRDALLVGEPAKVDVTWSAEQPTYLSVERVQLFIEGNGSSRPWLESTNGFSCGITVPWVLEPGAPRKTSHVLAATGGMHGQLLDLALAFPTPGVYRLQARYSANGGTRASNWLRMTVQQPEDSDAWLLENLVRKKPWVLTEWIRLFEPAELPRLFAQYPNSPYLARARVFLWDKKLEEAWIAAPDVPPDTPVGGDVPSLLAEVAGTPLSLPFDEDRLMLLARHAERTGWRHRAIAAWKEILEKYPDGAAAQEARGH